MFNVSLKLLIVYQMFSHIFNFLTLKINFSIKSIFFVPWLSSIPEEISIALALVKFRALNIFSLFKPPDKIQGLKLLSHDSLSLIIFQSKDLPLPPGFFRKFLTSVYSLL